MAVVRKLNFTPESKLYRVLLFVGANQFSFVATPPTPIIRCLYGMSFFIKTITFFTKTVDNTVALTGEDTSEFVKRSNKEQI